MGHAVSEAAARSVRKSQAVKAAERIPEQILKDIRSNLAAKLAVTPADQAWLLEQYDAVSSCMVEDALAYNALHAQYTALDEKDYPGQVELMQKRITELVGERDKLTEQNEEFRRVYEMENSHATVTVECAMSPGGANEMVSEH